jgi:hypothetical protein
MSETVEHLLLEYLRRLDRKVDALGDSLREARAGLSGVVQVLAAHDAHMLRVEMRLGEIERRLELHDPALRG